MIRRPSNQAISGVWAAALATGGSIDNVQPGLDFFKQLNDAGNFVPVDRRRRDRGVAATRRSGSPGPTTASPTRTRTPADPPVEVAVPTSGRFGGMYVQAISKYGAPSQRREAVGWSILYSDEGQLIWLKGYCNPIRYDDLVARAVVPAELAAKLPDTTGAVFPTLDQLTAATTAITAGWPTTIGVMTKSPRCRPTVPRRLKRRLTPLR